MNLYQNLHRRLGWKLFLSYLVVILVGVVVLTMTAEFVIPTTFTRHMSGMMMGQNDMMRMMGGMDNLFTSFRAAFNEALLLASLAAVFSAGVASFLVTRRVVAPVQAMTRASQRIAEGKFEERVPISSQPGYEDELGALALSFNRMATQLERTDSLYEHARVQHWFVPGNSDIQAEPECGWPLTFGAIFFPCDEKY